jgi:hypothetical protein
LYGPEYYKSFFTLGQQIAYESLPSDFQSLVPEDHPLVNLYKGVFTSPIDDFRKNKPMLQLWRLLQSDLRNQCEGCGAILADAQETPRHKKVCLQTSTVFNIHKLLLNFDRRVYYCVVCGLELMEPRECAGHLVTQHSKEELWRWSLHLDFLRVFLGSKV